MVATMEPPGSSIHALCLDPALWVSERRDCIQIVLAKYPTADPYTVGLLVSTLVSKHLDTAVVMTVENDSLRSPCHIV